jgi:hypothetical protein
VLFVCPALHDVGKPVYLTAQQAVLLLVYSLGWMAIQDAAKHLNNNRAGNLSNLSGRDSWHGAEEHPSVERRAISGAAGMAASGCYPGRRCLSEAQSALATFFEGWRDAARHAEELADAAIDRAIRKLPEEPVIASRVATAYIRTIADFIFKEYRAQPQSVALLRSSGSTCKPRQRLL